jgi:ribonuclease E
MLIDATDPAEFRVVVLNRGRVEDFDHEIRSKAQLKGNIYLAKVTRVEPSLQAAFVDYGGNRHGFLPFSEIHPDYYRIPIADREALLAEEAALKAAAEYDDEDEEDLAGAGDDVIFVEEEPLGNDALIETGEALGREAPATAPAEGDDDALAGDFVPEEAAPEDDARHTEGRAGDEPADGDEDRAPEDEDAPPGGRGRSVPQVAAGGESLSADPESEQEPGDPESDDGGDSALADPADAADEPVEAQAEVPADRGGPDRRRQPRGRGDRRRHGRNGRRREPVEEGEGEAPVDTVGGDELEDGARRRARLLRRYKIQEVVKRGQVMLVQVAKEERGNKGAALTTYLSLPGRYCVLMPNTARGGGISRKIGSAADRRRLKQVLGDLSIPDGMAVIVRTAGSERSKAEIKRDYEYLLRLWSEIRQNTLSSQAPALIYEEGNLIKRSIRDLYTSDTEEILVEGEDAYKAAKAFMKSLMPSHAKKVQLHKDATAPLFLKHGVESQLSGMFEQTVHLRSGGYIVINVTEALVAIDVNSGKATRERHIEETALKTNVEAADEVARQLRLRDLAGLIVIDFIDMEEPRHNREVERRLKEAMKSDRARIQLGRISPFGLLELSRQRLRPSLVDTAMVTCQHCHGTGKVYSAETATLHLLRALSEEGMRRAGGPLTIQVGPQVALFLLNQKRQQLNEIEARFSLQITIESDETLQGLEHRFERDRAVARPERGERERERGGRQERDRGTGRGERDRGSRHERGRDSGREAAREPVREASPEASPEGGPEVGREGGREAGREQGERRGRRDDRDRRGGRERREERHAQPHVAAAPDEPVDLGEIADEPLPERGGEQQGAADRGDADQRARRRRRGKRGGRRRNRQREGQEAPQQGSATGEPFDGTEPGFEPELAEGNGWEGEPERQPAGAEPAQELATEPEWRLPEQPVPDEEAEDDLRGAPDEHASPLDVVTEPEPGQPRKRGWWNRLVR